MIEKTLVVIKPDGVERNLIGEILSRFEKSGLKIVAAKMVKVKKAFAKKHYTASDEQVMGMGNKTLQASRENNLYDEIIKVFGTDDPKKIGMVLRNAMVKFLVSGPVFAVIFEGENAIKEVRRITGFTDPAQAEKGTVRADFGSDSIVNANSDGRPVRNVVHASGNVEEAKREIRLWFPEMK